MSVVLRSMLLIVTVAAGTTAPLAFSLCYLLLPLWMAVCVATGAGQANLESPTKLVVNQSAATKQREAEALLNAGRSDAAIEVLRQALATSSSPSSAADVAQVNHLLGLAYYQKSDFAKAVDHLSLAVKEGADISAQQRYPRHQQSVQMLGLAYYFTGRLREAIPHLEQSRTSTPDNIEIAYALGISYTKTRNTEQARETYAGMFKVAATSAAAHLINAQMMIRQQLEDFAEKELQKALMLDPRLPQANFLLGELAIHRAQIDLGIELLQKEIAVNPAFGMAYYRLGEAYTRQLKWDVAITPLQKSIWLNPFFSGPYIVLGKVYLKQADLPNAEDMLRRAIKMDPNNFSAHHLLAQVLQQSGKPEEARKEIEQAERLRTSGAQ